MKWNKGKITLMSMAIKILRKNFLLFLAISVFWFILPALVPSSAAFNFGDLLKELEVPEKQQTQSKKKSEQKKPPQKEEAGGLLGLGKALGLDKNTTNIIDKSARALQSLRPIQYKEEAALGGAIATQVFSRFGGSYNDQSLLKYVNLIGNSIAMFSDRSNIPYHFAILNNSQPNAFAAPGGYIFVTIGLLKKIKNEAELAGVLEHEIAHISQKHTLKTLQRSKRLQGISELTMAAMDKDPKMFSDIIDNISKTLFEKGLDKNLEYEADKIGTEYAFRVGYNPSGLNDFLKTLNKIQGSQESIFFKTHPSPRDRIKKLSRNVLPNYRGTSAYPKLSSRFEFETRGKL